MKRPLILHIDDSELVLQIVARGLEKAGFDVVSIDGFAGVSDALRKHGLPDLILLDIRMPAVQGDDLAEFFLQKWRLSMPIVLFSDLPKDEINKRVAASGATAGVRKHEGLPVLIGKITAILNVDTRHLGPHWKPSIEKPPKAPAEPAPATPAAVTAAPRQPANQPTPATAVPARPQSTPQSTPQPEKAAAVAAPKQPVPAKQAANADLPGGTGGGAGSNGHEWSRQVSLWAARVRQLLAAGKPTRESWTRRLPQVRRELHWLREESTQHANPLAGKLATAAAAAFDAADGDPAGCDILAAFVAIMIEVAAGHTQRGTALLQMLTGQPPA